MSDNAKTSNSLEEKILRDPSTSHWLKKLIKEAGERDLNDAICDIEILHELLLARHMDLIKQHGVLTL